MHIGLVVGCIGALRVSLEVGEQRVPITAEKIQCMGQGVGFGGLEGQRKMLYSGVATSV